MNQAKNSPILIIVIGIAAIAFSVYSYTKQSSFVENSVEAKGKIISVTEGYSTSGSKTKIGKFKKNNNKKVYKPVVEYTVDSDTYTFTALTGSKTKSTYVVNDSIAILYDSNDPTQVQVKQQNKQMTTMLAGGGGLVVMIIGLVMQIKKKKVAV